MEYHAKSGASSLKIEQVMINLVFAVFAAFLPFLRVFAVFEFLRFLRFVYMEYHAKSGASSLKIERVMLNLVYRYEVGHFFLVVVGVLSSISSSDYTVQTCNLQGYKFGQ